jgi:hypothetical protein
MSSRAVRGPIQVGSTVEGAVNGVVRIEGNVFCLAGNPIGGNAADTTDDILGGLVLPAWAFDQAGRQLNLFAQGITGATTNNKRFKLWLNPTMSGQTVTKGVISGGTVSGVGSGVLLADSGTWVNATTPNNAAGWYIEALVTKYGARGSNTQMGQAQTILGTLHGGINAGQAMTLPENASINVVVSGSSYTTGAAGDVNLQQLTGNWCN